MIRRGGRKGITKDTYEDEDYFGRTMLFSKGKSRMTTIVVTCKINKSFSNISLYSLVVLLLLVRIHPSTSLALSLSLSSSSSELPPPQPADIAFTHWAKLNGIFSPNIVCLTTEQSVGGRGLFATSSMQPGQVLASIPYSLIFHSDDPEDWAADITKQVLHLKKKTENTSNNNKNKNNDDEQIIIDPRTEWVNSWNGGGCTSWEDAIDFTTSTQPSSSSPLTDDPALRDEVQQRLNKRIQTWKVAAEKYQLDEMNDFALYSLIYSRACFLGQTWAKKDTNDDQLLQDDDNDDDETLNQNSSSQSPTTTTTTDVIGVIPLFDMLNHYYPHGQSNVELLSVGTAFARMERTNKNNNNANNSNTAPASAASTSKKPIDLNDKDMLLLATKPINIGEELLTEYIQEKGSDEEDDDDDNSQSPSSVLTKVEIKARKLIQWGFL